MCHALKYLGKNIHVYLLMHAQWAVVKQTYVSMHITYTYYDHSFITPKKPVIHSNA